MIELTKGQEEARKKSRKWFKTLDKQVFTIAGYAGTGKSTIVEIIIKELNLNKYNDVVYMTYVGKAALNLRRHGVPARTIHSVIYELVEVRYKLDKDGNMIPSNNPGDSKLIFRKRDKLLLEPKLFVIDEASMVNEDIRNDILSFGIPIIVLGDLGQLKPVFGNAGFLKNPDVILTEIMRQKQGDPIVYLSMLARQGKRIDYGKYGKRCFVMSKDQVTDKMLELSDVIICGTNDCRQYLNKYVREQIFNRTSFLPEYGDKMICRKNNWGMMLDDIPLINGLSGICANPVDMSSFKRNIFKLDFQPDFMNEYFKDIDVDYTFLNTPCSSNKKGNPYEGNKFEYGYAITTHLSQGSQYDKVLFNYERFGDKDNQKRQLYTGVTRATDMLILSM